MGFFLLSSGMMALPAHAEAPKVLAVPGYIVTLTAYNAVPEQTDGDPLVTASGAYSNPEIVAARSRDLADTLPFGTIIEIEGPTNFQNDCGYTVVKPIIGYRVIADTMNARYSDRIDVLFSTASNYSIKNGGTKNAAMILGICNGVTIRVVGHMNLNHSNQIPKTQAELAAFLGNDGNDLAVK